MIPDRVYILYTLIALQGHLIQCRKRNSPNSFEIDDNLLQRRCEFMYLKDKRCNIDELYKPGQCPKNPNSILEEICLDDCKGNDYECPGTKKCCKQDCGFSCQDTVGLDADLNVPPIPFNITISDRRRNGKMSEIAWQIPQHGTQRLDMFFVVETRSHIGTIFSQRKLGPWQWCNFHKIAEVKSTNSFTTIIIANIKLRMGLWYQIRIAAINEYGYRGYSNYSREFRLTDQNHVAEPKPPRPPKNFTVRIIGSNSNQMVHAKATWITPKSDLPIDRYTISWARYLNADIASLFLNDDYVREPTTSYELRNLVRDSVYYVQVQAISTSGRRRFKSPKVSFILNTTITKTHGIESLRTENSSSVTPINNTEYNLAAKPSLKKLKQDLHFRFVANKKFGMLVRVWSDKGCLLELCTGITDCETKEYGAIRPRKDHIDFSKLKFNTQYTLRVSERDGLKTTKTLTTPKCEQWIAKFPNLSIICDMSN